MLARDETTITIEGKRVTLRPTLRAALRLERRHGGFDRILAGILDGNLSTMADVIAECADVPCDLPAFLMRTGPNAGLRVGVESLIPALVAHVYALAGIDVEALDDPANESANDQAARTSFAEHNAKLFSIATGWLGWTPADAWSSTPAEIAAAYRGRLDMLKAIFGSNEKEAKPTDSRSLDEKFSAFFASKDAKIIRRKKSEAPSHAV
jgi:hypothetical protein